jgi:DNA-binding transcriptional ArsR family regulator
MQKKGTLIMQNENTGDEEETSVNIIMLPKQHFKRGGFMIVSKDLARLIVKPDLNLTGLDTKLFFALCERVDAGNRINTFTQSQLAKKLQTSQPNVSNSLKKLLEHGVIEKIGLDYYFADKYVWTGGRKKTKKA